MRIETEVFFRPEVISRESSTIRADLYNDCRHALAQSVTDCAFVPVRSMQLYAVITRDEIIFVDALNYAVQDGRGGRLIMLAWDFGSSPRRTSLDRPVAVEILVFHKDAADLHNRIMSELPVALAALEKSRRADGAVAGKAEIVPFRQPG